MMFRSAFLLPFVVAFALLSCPAVVLGQAAGTGSAGVAGVASWCLGAEGSSSSSSGASTGTADQGASSVSVPRIVNMSPDKAQPAASRDNATPQPAQQNSANGVVESGGGNEFQDMVSLSLGRTLPMFGYNLFQGVPSTFAPVENIPVTPDYTIGPGDELLIRAWGQIDIEYRAVVDRNGTINIPRVGVINVAGIKYQALTEYVKTAVSRNFRNFELTVTMGQLRSVQVLVLGQARRPGNYTVSSLSTLVNAIFAAGGPSARGSMRGIQLKRGNQTIAEMDLYDLLVYGDKSKDQQLLPGDVIYFPPIGPLAAVSGSVNNPAIFELKGNTSMDQLVRWAGGLTTTAQTRSASIERIRDRTSRAVEQFSLDAEGLKKQVRDGDVVSIFSITPRFENAVSLRGNVAAPLRYPYAPGMRIRDLIPEREALITPDYYMRKNLVVRADVQSQPQLRADVRRPAEINWDYAAIERLNPNDLSTTLIPFNLGKAVLEADPANNLALQPGDVVTIFSKDDIQVPQVRQTRYIRLDGEFNQAGVYQIQPGETLRQLVIRIGGVAPQAYLFGSEFTRESTRVQQQKSLDDALNRLGRDIQRAGASRAQNTITAEDAAASRDLAESQRTLLAQLRQVRANGRIVLALGEASSAIDLPDLQLEDGDHFFVPAPPSTVQVIGSVFNPSALIYRPGKQMSDYLAEAGGPTRDADQGSIYVLRADGTVVSARQSGILSGLLLSGVGAKRLMPGDAVVVPEELDKTTFMRNLKDVAQIFYHFGLGAAAIKVLRN